MTLPSAKEWSPGERYVLAVATILLAVVLQAGLRSLIGDNVPFMFLHPSLVLIAVYCGRGPALLALLLSAVHAAVTLRVFAGEPGVAMAPYSVIIYAVVGLAIVLLTSALTRAAQRAQEAELRLRIIQDDAAVGLWEMDLPAGTVLASRSMWRLMGLPPLEHPVPISEWRRHALPEEVAASIATAKQQVGTGASFYEQEFRAQMPSGELRHFLARVNVEYGEDLRAQRLRAAVVDVSRRKQLEAEQQRHIQDLREIDRRRTEFLATLAHELRNPLAPIRHATLLAQSPRATHEQVQWSLSVIDRQTHYMARLLDDLLETSRVSRGALELRTQPIELTTVMNMAVETALPLIETKGHALDNHLPSTPIWLNGDPVRLAQIFSNLLTNAAKYTPAQGHISIKAELVEEHVCVRVCDTGIGIAPDVLPRLFEMFAQADQALEHAQGGLGIGLALVKGLVQLHGGKVEAHSAGLNHGSEFVVHLPRIAAPSQYLAPAAPLQVPVVPRRILIADDNRDAADSLAALLELDGHEIHVAYDGAEALELCLRQPPHIGLLDIGMPKLDGYELARRVRAQSWGNDIKLIAITGWGERADRTRALEAGFTAHLTKPVSAASLAAVLADVESNIAAA
ncbi:MAG: ATP-binding protein [Steroidobacteraceae bacterium]